jgi:hypothetical protein
MRGDGDGRLQAPGSRCSACGATDSSCLPACSYEEDMDMDMDMDSAAAAARVGWHWHQIGRTALHATPATAPPGVACVRLFGAGTEEEDGGRVRRAGRLRSTRARWMAAQGRRRRQCQFMNHNEALYLPCPCPCAASRCMYVLLPSRVGGGVDYWRADNTMPGCFRWQ